METAISSASTRHGIPNADSVAYWQRLREQCRTYECHDSSETRGRDASLAWFDSKIELLSRP